MLVEKLLLKICALATWGKTNVAASELYVVVCLLVKMSAPFRIQHAGVTGFAATTTCVHCALYALKSIITPVNWLIVVQMLHW